MRAVHFNGAKLECINHPDPVGDTLVSVDLAGICGTDLEILGGYMGYSGIPGHEFVGTVVKSDKPDLIGKRVAGEINAGCTKCDYCKRGMSRHCPDRTVLGILNHDGAFAEYLSLPSSNLHVIPDSISDEQAVFIEPLAAAFEILEQVDVRPEWRVAIVGDGRLAQLVCRVLHLPCSDVTCFGRHPSKLAALDPGIKTSTTIAGYEQKFDLVVDAAGSSSGLADAIKLARPRGHVIAKSTVSKHSADLTPAIINEITITGSRCGLFEPAIRALATGVISVDKLAGRTFPLSEVHEAFEHAKRPDTLKVFLKP